ncbi:MAG: outer membrane beta-barrel protein [Bacteroidetes bacterium]|nr:outer membrane beta-barrel protein [Bacteroidota bacterium]
MFNRIKVIIVFIALIIVLTACLSQSYSQSEDSEYAVTAYINAGYSRFISELDYKDLNKNGFSGTIRIMWEPEHLLSIGIESGYLQLYDISTQLTIQDTITFTGSSELTAVPILAVYSMELFENFKLSVGSGMFLLTSKVDALGNPVNSNQVSTGVLASGSYHYPLSSTISLGGEIKYYLINKIEDGDLTIQFSLQYKFLIY